MIRAFLITLALSIYLALMGDHKPLPAGLIWRGDRIVLDDSKGATHV